LISGRTAIGIGAFWAFWWKRHQVAAPSPITRQAIPAAVHTGFPIRGTSLAGGATDGNGAAADGKDTVTAGVS
jgi:hypothetical protein